MKKIILLTGFIFCSGWATMAQYSKIDNNDNYAVAKENINGSIKVITMPRPLLPELSVPVTNNQYAIEKTAYLRKSHNRKIAAWSFLGGGAVITAIGILTFPQGYDALFDTNSSSDDNKASIASDMAVLGIACMITSIPFFISASMNKRKASLSISSQKTGFGVPKNVSKSITGISMTIPIGK